MCVFSPAPGIPNKNLINKPCIFQCSIATMEVRPSTSYTGVVYVTHASQYGTSPLPLFLYTFEAYRLVYRSYTPLYGAYQTDPPYPTGHLVWQLTAPYYRPGVFIFLSHLVFKFTDGICRWERLPRNVPIRLPGPCRPIPPRSIARHCQGN